MKFILFLAAIIIGVLFFKEEIFHKIEGDVKKIPNGVALYNDEVYGKEALARDINKATELKAVCLQYDSWRREGLTKNFAQNCLDSEFALR